MLLCGVSSEVLGRVYGGKAAAGEAGSVRQADFTVVLRLACQKVLEWITALIPASLA